MKVLEVICARYDEERHLMHLVKEIEKPDGTVCLNLTMFSPSLLTARAAEYEIDDVDELVDMVVYGGHIEEVNLMSMPAAAARNLHRERTLVAKQELVSKRKVGEDKTTKLRNAGVDQSYIDAASEEVADVIKRHCTPDPMEVKQLRRKVQAKRLQAQFSDGVKHTNKVAARADMERQKLVAQAAAKVQREQPQKPTHVVVHLSKKPKAS